MIVSNYIKHVKKIMRESEGNAPQKKVTKLFNGLKYITMAAFVNKSSYDVLDYREEKEHKNNSLLAHQLIQLIYLNLL